MHPPSHGIKSWFHAPTFTATHCIIDPETRHCAILDSVLDFDYASGRTSTAFADRIAAFVREQGLTVDWLLESHAHADHLSAAPYLKQLFGGQVAIGEHIRDVQ
ncbi:MAG: MBL fold metallo-hydrolase, partial [Thiomonas sp.]